jgi:hypothetical protein
MTTTAQQQQDDAVWTTLELTGHETRMLHHVLGIVMERPATFGVRGNGSAEVKAILISTAANLRSKLGTPPPPAKPKPAKSAKPTRPASATTAGPARSTPAVTAPPVPAVAFSAGAPDPRAPDPRAPETETPAAVPAAETSTGTTKGMKHFLVVYSRTKRRPLHEQEFASFADAFRAQKTATAKWSGDDIETHVITGPSRAVLVSAQPQYFRKRPPNQSRIS